MVVLEAFQQEFPELDIIVEMDRKNAPYGDKSSKEIQELTLQWVKNLFKRWADVIILACNTASVHVLRWLQREKFPDKYILGVMIPWAEAIVEWWYKKVWILATKATVDVRWYAERVHILDSSIDIEEIGTVGIVAMIENQEIETPQMREKIRSYIKKFSPDREVLVLWCTHFPLIRSHIESLWEEIHGKPTPAIIDPGKEAAKKFHGWIKRKGLLIS